MTKLPIICLALARWDGPYSSTAFSLAKELAYSQPVYYLDNPFTWKDLVTGWRTEQINRRKNALIFRKKIYTPLPDKTKCLTVVTPPPVWPINWLPPGRIYNTFARRNNRRTIHTIRRILRENNLSKYILLNVFNPFVGFDLPEDLRPALSVYYSVDAIAESVYIQKHGPTLEDRMLREADICLTTSSELLRTCTAKTDKPVYLLPNGADVQLFRQAVEKKLPRPAELEGETRPVIIYTGAIGLRNDFELMKKIAEVHHDKLLLLVGPITETYQEVGLRQMKNVRFTGSKPLEELPGYLQYADCAIIPFRCNALTRSIYPLKLHEYLAAGKAVVSTPFSPDIEAFGRYIRLAGDHTAFVDAIEEALKDHSPENVKKRQTIATENDWSARVEALREIMADHLRIS
ncbi:MAG: glycosyltransferase [Bacteroidia bacterium]|nr:glycosyltransferase [Bacteroidia bacterium]